MSARRHYFVALGDISTFDPDNTCGRSPSSEFQMSPINSYIQTCRPAILADFQVDLSPTVSTQYAFYALLSLIKSY